MAIMQMTRGKSRHCVPLVGYSEHIWDIIAVRFKEHLLTLWPLNWDTDMPPQVPLLAFLWPSGNSVSRNTIFYPLLSPPSNTRYQSHPTPFPSFPFPSLPWDWEASAIGFLSVLRCKPYTALLCSFFITCRSPLLYTSLKTYITHIWRMLLRRAPHLEN